MTHAPDPAEVRALREALVRTATALDGFIQLIGEPRRDGSARMGAILSREQVQEALEANNDARIALEATEAPPVAGMGEGGQDRKFKFENGQFVNRVSGEPIPADEPIIIFRARDWHSLGVLEAYAAMIEHPHHQQAVAERIAEFTAFAKAHPERMKEPGITQHIVLTKPTPPACVSGEVGALWRKLKQARAVGDLHGWDHYAAQLDATLAAAPEAATPSAVLDREVFDIIRALMAALPNPDAKTGKYAELRARARAALATDKTPSAVGGVDRMREALEEIAQFSGPFPDIARAALASGETSPERGERVCPECGVGDGHEGGCSRCPVRTLGSRQ